MPRIVQVTFSAISDDPRVRRHGDGLKTRGWDVVGLGLQGGRSEPPDWPVFMPPPPQPIQPEAQIELVPPTADTRPPQVQRPIWKLVARAVWFIFAAILAGGAWLVGSCLGPFFPDFGAWLRRSASIVRTDIGWPIRTWRRSKAVIARIRQKPVSTLDGAMRELERRKPVSALIEAGQQIGHADVWVANDWHALPVAFALRAQFGGLVVYDSHEYALEEYAQDLGWRWVERPIAATIERFYIGQTLMVTSVSQGIADALKRIYRLTQPVARIPNAPPYHPRNLRSTGETVKILYHGVVSPGRGLETMIAAAKHWKSSAQLFIRGPVASPSYKAGLELLIQQLGVSNRVTLLPPVMMIDLVEAASHFDIGVMILPGHSDHNRFALPNKIFEYMAAGLAVLVNDLPEMGAVIRSTQAGLIVGSTKPAAIAALIDQITPSNLDTMKRNALEAARYFNAEANIDELDKAYRSLIIQQNGLQVAQVS